MLERAGFDSITTCADFTKAPATQDTHTVIHSARHSH